MYANGAIASSISVVAIITRPFICVSLPLPADAGVSWGNGVNYTPMNLAVNTFFDWFALSKSSEFDMRFNRETACIFLASVYYRRMDPKTAIDTLRALGWSDTTIAAEMKVTQPTIWRLRTTSAVPNYDLGTALVALAKREQRKSRAGGAA
jgi:hypothetical protein